MVEGTVGQGTKQQRTRRQRTKEQQSRQQRIAWWPRAVIHVTRLTWIAVGATGWWALSQALDTVGSTPSPNGRRVVAIALMVVWAAGFVGTLVPSVWSLTLHRLGSVPITIGAATMFATPASTAASAAVTVATAAHMAMLASADTGTAYVQASAYGDEQRFPLKAPARFLPAAVISVAVWSAAAVATAWAVATGRTALAVGGVAVVGGLGWLLALSCHRLARRWLVVVPAGVVIHDHVVLSETLMVSRQQVSIIGLASADSEAADLSGPAAGLVLDIRLQEMATVLIAPDRDHPKGRAIHVQSFLVAPSRPGAALTAIAARRLPVG